LAKYQLDKGIFQTIRWKYFHPFNKPHLQFSSGDLLFFAGKFMIEDRIEYITVAYATIVNVGDLDDGFKSDEIPLCVLHFMFPVKVKHNPKICDNIVYFWAECYVYNSFTTHDIHMDLIVSYPAQATRFNHLHDYIKIGCLFVVFGFIKFEKPDIIVLEATDIDYLSFFDFNYNTTLETSPSTVSKSLTVPTLSTTPQELDSFDVNVGITSNKKDKKKLSDLVLDSLNLGAT
ncbi:12363_t:CDS:2, partial [Cetraspora pellucida]